MPDVLNFEAKDYSLRDVMFLNGKFIVPRFQRPYSWNEDQLTDFWLDLTSSTDTYFFGSFILNNETEADTGYIEIVDGQQRMITVTILLAVIRDLFKELDPVWAKRIQLKHIAHDDDYGVQSYLIQCSESAREYFKDHVQFEDAVIAESEPQTPETKQIKKNYEFFLSKVTENLEELSPHEKKEYLINLRDNISKITVIKIEITGEDAAYEIFETTNARGVDLSIADLLKNLIFKHIRAQDDRDEAKETWAEIVSNVQNTKTEMRKFIRYYWLSKYPPVTEKNLFRDIKRKITNWNALLQDLRIASNHFSQLIEGAKEDWSNMRHGDKIFQSIEAIRFMNVSQCYVLFLSILRNLNKLGSDPTRLFEIIEKFTFVYSVVCKQPGNKVEKLYSKHARAIEQAITERSEKKIHASISRVFSQLVNDLKQEVPSYEVFKEKFAVVSYVDSSIKRRLISYILSKLNAIGQTGEHRIDFDNVNIEHLLPRNPSRWGLTKAEVKPYVDLLGNLTLLAEKFNSSIGNSPLDEKLKLLSESEIRITQELVGLVRSNSNTWNVDSIMLRQTRFGDTAYHRIWQI